MTSARAIGAKVRVAAVADFCVPRHTHGHHDTATCRKNKYHDHGLCHFIQERL